MESGGDSGHNLFISFTPICRDVSLLLGFHTYLYSMLVLGFLMLSDFCLFAAAMLYCLTRPLERGCMHACTNACTDVLICTYMGLYRWSRPALGM